MAKAAKKSKFRIVMTVFLVVTLILIILVGLGCAYLYILSTGYTLPKLRASYYSEEEHLQRVSERVRATFIDGDRQVLGYNYDENKRQFVKATNFSVYPLYNANDELQYVLVEFQPCGYAYVLIRDVPPIPKCLAFGIFFTSMYELSNKNGQHEWTPWQVNVENKERKNNSDYSISEPDRIYECDENGQTIKYVNSPYKVKGVENEKLYLIDVNKDVFLSIPAIKRDGKFINLISNEAFEVIDGRVTTKQSYEGMDFFFKVKDNELD